MIRSYQVSQVARSLDSGSSGQKAVGIQIPPTAPTQKLNAPRKAPQTRKTVKISRSYLIFTA